MLLKTEGLADGCGETLSKVSFSGDAKRDNKPKRGLQLRCEACGKSFDKTRGRRKRFCSDACRAALQRAKEANSGSGVEFSVAFGNALNSRYNSKAYKPKTRDLHPSRFSVPLDLLGKGHRWS